MKRKAVLYILALLFAFPVHATYVNSGKHDYSSGTSITCVPNSGGVTSGDGLVLGLQVNSGSGLTIGVTGTRSTWTLGKSDCGSGDCIQTYYATATSSGSETITITASASTLMGAACGEWTSTFSVATETGGTSGTISVSTGQDIVAFASSSGGGASLLSPFTQRQQLLFGGTPFAAFGDITASSSGSYTATFTSVSTVFLVAAPPSATPAYHRRAQVIRDRGKRLFQKVQKV